jgi:hypothetical protein
MILILVSSMRIYGLQLLALYLRDLQLILEIRNIPHAHFLLFFIILLSIYTEKEHRFCFSYIVITHIYLLKANTVAQLSALLINND